MDRPADRPPRALVVRFWTAVALVKLAVLAFGFGAVLVVATDYVVAGVMVLGVGMLAAVRSIRTVRTVRGTVG